MVHVVQPLTVETTNDVHNVAKDNRAMEGPWLRLLCAYCFYLRPLSLIDIKLVDVVEPLLIRVNSTKNVDLARTYYS